MKTTEPELFSTRQVRKFNERMKREGNQPSDPRTFARLPVDREGYVLGAECRHDHSGNRRLVQDGADCQCQGCLQTVSTLFLWKRLWPHQS